MQNKKIEQHGHTCDESPLDDQPASITSNSAALNKGVSCPVCHTKPCLNNFDFVLHFLSCSAKTLALPRQRLANSLLNNRSYNNHTLKGIRDNTSRGVPTKTHCIACKTIYTSRSTNYEIEFHEDECRKNNHDYMGHYNDKILDESEDLRIEEQKSSGKRSVEVPETRRAMKHARTLFKECASGHSVEKTLCCAICLSRSSNNKMVQCSSVCGQVFHIMCIKLNKLQKAKLSESKMSDSILADQFSWTCGHCLRALHVCHVCGYLGKHGEDLLQCSVARCRKYFHYVCVGLKAHNPITVSTSILTCSKNRCDGHCSIHGQKNQMETLSASYSKICIGNGGGQNNRNNDTGRVMCETCRNCDNKCSMEVIRRRGFQRSLQSQLSIGEIVLVLPERYLLRDGYCSNNDPLWGIVVRAELLKDYISYEHGISDTEHMSHDNSTGYQILIIESFKDARTWNLTNAQVLPIAEANSFDTPFSMLRSCIEWYTYIQCVAFLFSEGRKQWEDIVNERTNLLQRSCAAFRGYTRKIMLAHTHHHDALTSMSWESAQRGFEKFERSIAILGRGSFAEVTEAPIFTLL